MSSRYDKHTPVIQLDEITSAEETALAELVALANSPAGQFIRKESGAFVNATLSETITLSGLSDVLITSVAGGDIIYYSNVTSSWVNLGAGQTGYLLTAQGVGSAPTWTAVGAGTVTTVSVVTANGVSATVADATTTPALTFTLGAITPTTVNGLTITANGTNTLSITAGKTLTILKTISFTAADDTGVYTLPTGTKTLLATDGAGTSLTGIPYTLTGTANQVILSAGTGNITFTLPQSIGTASAVSFASLATSAASPLLLTNGQLITVALTSQTVGGATLTIPDFASVSDEFVFKTKSVTMSNKTFVAPALGTPASGVMTNVTGTAAGLTAGNVTTNANLTGHVTSVGNAAILGAFTLAQLNTAVSDADVASLAGTETLSNKTLTAPKLVSGGFIADANGNELLIGVTTASAVNELTTTNAATGNAPKLAATGTDTNINLDLDSKGTGIIRPQHAVVNKVVALTDGVNIATDASLGNIFTVTLAGNRTMDNPTNGTVGQTIIYRIKQDATGTRTLALGTEFRGSTDVPLPTLTTTANAVDYVMFIRSSVTTWDILATNKGFAS